MIWYADTTKWESVSDSHEYYGDVGLVLSSCLVCGAVVADRHQELHEKFHERLTGISHLRDL